MSESVLLHENISFIIAYKKLSILKYKKIVYKI